MHACAYTVNVLAHLFCLESSEENADCVCSHKSLSLYLVPYRRLS